MGFLVLYNHGRQYTDILAGILQLYFQAESLLDYNNQLQAQWQFVVQSPDSKEPIFLLKHEQYCRSQFWPRTTLIQNISICEKRESQVGEIERYNRATKEIVQPYS